MMVKIPTFSRIITEYITFLIIREKHTDLQAVTQNPCSSFLCQLMWFLLFSLNNMHNLFWKNTYYVKVIYLLLLLNQRGHVIILQGARFTWHIMFSVLLLCFYSSVWKVNLLLESSCLYINTFWALPPPRLSTDSVPLIPPHTYLSRGHNSWLFLLVHDRLIWIRAVCVN